MQKSNNDLLQREHNLRLGRKRNLVSVGTRSAHMLHDLPITKQKSKAHHNYRPDARQRALGDMREVHDAEGNAPRLALQQPHHSAP